MPSTEKSRKELQKKLAELFQLDQPDLDFGFYRIMHAKAGEVAKFIDADLLKDVEETFGKIDGARKAELKSCYEDALRQAKDYGAPDPEAAPAVKEAREAYESFKTGASSEAEVYDHLLRFFSRYYEGGDFLSRRYYKRENAGQAAPYAVPYSGEEVKLHWANADQYYVKSTEYFSHFTFDLNRETSTDLLSGEKTAPLRVHFRIVAASEGEHGNVKAAADKKRFFLLCKNKPVEFDENGELIVNFEYRNDPKKTGQDGTWQERRNDETVETLRKKLGNTKEAAEYRSRLFALAPTEKNPRRTVLARHLMQYTARNTMDYFIHKNLGEFLRRELDFYIKNEVMRLDDIDGADVTAVRSYLEKIKVIRKIGGKLIEFLAQLEDFQKKLWLKKKFVTETNYCITLDRIPEEFYPEIAANKAQRAEWIELFAIDEIEKTSTSPGYTKKLSVEFLKANDKLMLDTGYFDADFKARLIESIEDLDERCDGLLVHSENFQALNLLRERYREQVKCIYIDPPYNAKSSEILYKNSYRNASWLSMMADRLRLGKSFLAPFSSQVVAIDEVEQELLGRIITDIFADWSKACVSIVHNPRGQQGKNVSFSHEFAYFVYPNDRDKYLGDIKRTETDSRNLRDSGTESNRTDAKTCFYPIIVQGGAIKSFGDVPPETFHPGGANVLRKDGSVEIWPIDKSGAEKKWRYSRNSVETIRERLTAEQGRSGLQIIFHKDTGTMRSFWADAKYDASEYGTKVLQAMLGEEKAAMFSYPKSIHTVKETLSIQFCGETDGVVLDYFGGSGTTAHATVALNRERPENPGNRKYVLVEMGAYFNTVLKPRMKKVVYDTDWQAGKPQNRDTGISHCFKYVRLESYEDTLNNLRFDDVPAKSKLLGKSKSLREDYMLRYMLDVETRGSQSLLNIDAFAEPEKYLLRVKKADSDASEDKPVDLLETFNYLIGLRVDRIGAPQRFHAKFRRIPDPEVPEDQQRKLAIKGKLDQAVDGQWMFRAVYGWIPKNPLTPNDGLREKVLVVWRNLTGDPEKDNTVLDEWFHKNRIDPRGLESDTAGFDVIYVNGSNNLPNLKRDAGKVKLIEEEFFKRMWDVE